MSTLNTFGYQHYLDTFSEPTDISRGIPARVTAVHRDLLELVTNTGKLRGRLKGTTYRDITADRPTVGDFVVVETHSEAEGTITKTLPRRTVLLRKDPDQGRAAQAVAANFDTAFLMASLNADLNLPRLER
ncbi:MAG: hypothetical protein FWG25_11665, partial [Promicromonosporaceae bacterium]|nr:hypothetical protein [Promicromonosporaceae bacterium]